MADIIHLLPDNVANQIAAGEVIQRPASVIKELVENSIDAGGGVIHILIKDAGKTSIQVIDNGKGMSETDARMAFERHATSKISDASDLFSIRTMGFRGEALASIASVSQVEMKTRRSDDELGIFLEIAGSRVFKQDVTHCDIGTSILVRNLFFNVPARRRFLKSDNVEKTHIFNEFYRIALVNPEVEFHFFDNDVEVFSLPVANIKQRIENIFGKNPRKRLQQQLLSIQTDTNIVSIKGFIGKPEFAQKYSDQYFFVNGRFIKHPYFNKAVMLAYNQLIKQGESPSYFIYLEVDTETIDINIHPTKTEVKFENEQAIWSILNATVKESLGKFNVVPSIDFDQDGAPDFTPVRNLENIQPPKTNFNPDYNPFQSTYSRPKFDWDKLYAGFETQKVDSFQNSLDFENEKVTPECDNNNIEINADLNSNKTSSIFQLKGKYILTSIKSGLMLIDQHNAHFRIVYETIEKQLAKNKSYSQQILFPEEISLSPDRLIIFNQIKHDLCNAGFTFENTGSNSYNIISIPSVLGTESAIAFINSMIDDLKESEINIQETFRQTLTLSLANVSAIKTGQALTEIEMNDLIDRLFSCTDCNYTPDGKKIFTVITNEEILNRFK